MKHPLLYLCAGSLIAAACGSPMTAAAETTNSVESVELPSRPLYYPWTIGAEIGSQGIFGMSASWRFSDHLGLRAGADFALASFDNTSIGGTHYDADLRFLSESLLLDIYPWTKCSFHISVGLLFNQNQLAGSATHSGITIIDGKPFPTDDVGTVSMKVEQQPVNPYVSIGGNFFYFDRAHHWAFAGELGVSYTGDQRVSLSRSGDPDPAIDDAMRNAQKRLQDFADQYKWWPVVKLMVTYSF